MEEWRSVEEWPYEVSSLGRVRRTLAAQGTQAGCVLRHNNSGRYSIVTLRQPKTQRTIQVHLLVARAFLGPCPPGHEVNHKDGNKHRPELANLEYLTRQGNAAHAVNNGLYMYGERHYAAKVTAADVLTIRTAVRAGESRKVLAARYGLSKSGLCHIISGKNWRCRPCESTTS